MADVPAHFVLYGGTALALRLAHRAPVGFGCFPGLDDLRLCNAQHSLAMEAPPHSKVVLEWLLGDAAHALGEGMTKRRTMEPSEELGVNSDAPVQAGCVLSGYLEQAMAAAHYDKLEDGAYAGRIPPCKGVIAFAPTLAECQRSLRSTLEDWLLLGLKLGHSLPVMSGLNLNGKPSREPLDAL